MEQEKAPKQLPGSMTATLRGSLLRGVFWSFVHIAGKYTLRAGTSDYRLQALGWPSPRPSRRGTGQQKRRCSAPREIDSPRPRFSQSTNPLRPGAAAGPPGCRSTCRRRPFGRRTGELSKHLAHRPSGVPGHLEIPAAADGTVADSPAHRDRPLPVGDPGRGIRIELLRVNGSRNIEMRVAGPAARGASPPGTPRHSTAKTSAGRARV